MRQSSFSFLKNYKKEFGGSLLLGKRKSQRPLSSKHPLHLVLRFELSGIFNPGHRSLERLIRQVATQFQIHIYDLALNWSHLHCVIRIKDRKSYNGFIRVLSSRLSTRVRSQKTDAQQKIFTLRPFTCVLSWGRDFQQALSYQILNQLEAYGLLCRKKTAKNPELRKLNPNLS
jgi:REP element-mobilizing transposase RayT